MQTNQSEEEEELGQTVEETITGEQLDEETETVGETRRKTLSETSQEVSEESGEEEEEEVTMAELELLKKLEEANRLIECDTKSLSCLSVGAVPKNGSGHSRTPSIASQESHGNSQETGDDLWVMWSDILKSWDRRKGANVKDLVRQGIPHHFRGMAWQVLCEAHQSQDKAKYSGLLRTQSACEKVIRLVLFVVVL